MQLCNEKKDNYIMLEVTTPRKHKVVLSDYCYERDIANRLILSEFTPTDVEILEALLYNSLVISITKLLQEQTFTLEDLFRFFDKMESSKLFSLDGDKILVDKEKRKYFETHLAKFDPDFEPNIEYVQNLLKKIPIHILPTWYSLPRTSDNIFQSIFEKYLCSVRVFEKYFSETHLDHPVLQDIVKDLYQSPQLQITAEEIRKKYSLSNEEFEECVLQLEFNFLACTIYISKEACSESEKSWYEAIVPFSEWRNYLLFRKVATPKPIAKSKNASINTNPLRFPHPPRTLCTEKNTREVERSLKALGHIEWIFFDDYLHTAPLAIDEGNHLYLKKQGKQWRYVLPDYSAEEQAFILGTLCNRFRDTGWVEVGILDGRDCFRITAQGRHIFGF